MAREVIEKLVDDLDGGEATETVSFGLDGTSYEIDLSRKNTAALRKTIERYVKAARRRAAGHGHSPQGVNGEAPRGHPEAGLDLAQLREWARSNGIEVPSRGRIPQAIVERYKSAGGR